ncbi:hypothetical protein [Haloactinopolyspora alba]|uniref:hypothetical protein n=1 Tax=Haloactinopolyspora alba TaxID=648780 RepID=UPI00101CEFDF|nr:hypothetical protein [Haloactinopolyspora alba]
MSESFDSTTSEMNAACAAPLTLVDPRTAAPGEEIRVTAKYMANECNDTGRDIEVDGLKNQHVVWTQGAAEIELAVVDADDETYEASTTVTVPLDAGDGPAEIAVGRAEPAELTVRAE